MNLMAKFFRLPKHKQVAIALTIDLLILVGVLLVVGKLFL